MSDRFQLLKSDMQAEMAAIEHIFANLPPETVTLVDNKEAIVVGYYLHNLYNTIWRSKGCKKRSVRRIVSKQFTGKTWEALSLSWTV